MYSISSSDLQNIEEVAQFKIKFLMVIKIQSFSLKINALIDSGDICLKNSIIKRERSGIYEKLEKIVENDLEISSKKISFIKQNLKSKIYKRKPEDSNIKLFKKSKILMFMIL